MISKLVSVVKEFEMWFMQHNPAMGNHHNKKKSDMDTDSHTELG